MQGRTKTNRQKQADELNPIPGVEPYYSRGGIFLYHGESLELLPQLPDGFANALITDPPYCSGGRGAGEKSQDPVAKYAHNGKALGRPTFSGDHLDQRAFTFWGTLWMGDCLRVVADNGYALVFTDWRQLPTTTDIVQAGGFVWRGIISWNKGRGARAPHKGMFRHQCEYIAWGTKGRCVKAEHGGPFEGCISETVKQSDKHHLTGKPTALMQQLVECVKPGGIVLDLFAGSGTTGVACIREGRRFVGFERSEEYCEISVRRFEDEFARSETSRRAA